MENKIKTAEEICNEERNKSSMNWRVFRKGINDDIVVLISNPPWGRLRSPMLNFKIFKKGKEVTTESCYEGMKMIVRKLKDDTYSFRI